MQHAVLAILSGPRQSTRCADALKSAGFTSNEISMLLPDELGAQELGYSRKNMAMEGIASGMISGAILGTGIALATSHLPVSNHPLNEVLGAGLLFSIPALAAVFATIMGLLGGLIGMFMSEYVVRKYDRKTRMNGSIIAVHAGNANDRRVIGNILRMEGAQDITSSNEDSKPDSVPLATH